MHRFLAPLLGLMLCMTNAHPLSHAQSIAVGFYNPDVFCYANTSLQLLTHSARWMNTIAPLQAIQPTDTSITTPLFDVLNQIKCPKYNALMHTWWPSVIDPSPFTTALGTRDRRIISIQADPAIMLSNLHSYLKKDYAANTLSPTHTQNLTKIISLDVPPSAFFISNAYKEYLQHATPAYTKLFDQFKNLDMLPPDPRPLATCMIFKLCRSLKNEPTLRTAPLIIERTLKLNNIPYELTGIILAAYDDDGGGHATALVKDIQFDPETGTWANNLPVWHFINDSSVSSVEHSKHIFEDIEAHGMHDTHGYPYMLLYQVTEPAMVT